MSEQHGGNADAAHETQWLYRRETLPQIWLAGCALRALTIVLNVFVDLHAKLGLADKKIAQLPAPVARL